MSDAARGDEVKRLFQATLERPVTERSASLAGAAEDEGIRSEVGSRLSAQPSSGDPRRGGRPKIP